MRKRILLLSTFIFLIVFLGACVKKNNYHYILGGGKPIEMVVEDANVKEYNINDSTFHNRPVVHICRKGGSFKISVTNYRWWQICGVSIKKSERQNFFFLDDASWRLRHLQKHYPDWYDMKQKDTSLYVNVKANNTSHKRTIKIDVSVGDVFSAIYVVQD